ncbi:hypothetical protein RD792_003292 [Penstemon davidsonii]|uniref:Fe2OG dioxygenase domain-containing protein n=1 Tax=Penstemon davidsonii TaxID=160366 RepID=A0ABR0DTD2_9LAMI|nr:hypothetical protein RD792_003292 [Penstemon davidsonii]
MKAGQEFGFFQLINHGIPNDLMNDVLKVAGEFFRLPAEDKASFYSEDPKKACRLYTSIDYDKEKVHYWRDNLRQSCHPLDRYIEDWPANPTRYRKVMGKYALKVREVSLLILDLICEGLGLELGYFEAGGLSNVQLMGLNYYPICPDPSLTLGLPKHSDVNVITLLNQGLVLGLQVLKDEEWLSVEPIPNAFLVNIGHTLQIISNGKLRSVDHRVVTNKHIARATIANFVHPSGDSQIAPATALIDKCNLPLYRQFTYNEFVRTYVTDTHQGTPPLKRYEQSKP